MFENVASEEEILKKFIYDNDMIFNWNKFKIDDANFFLKMHVWDYEEKLRLKHAKKQFKPILQKLKNPYVFEIEDHVHIGANLENGDLFDKWLVKKISQH